MTKVDVVRAEMVKAMKAGDKERKNALSMLLSALKKAPSRCLSQPIPEAI